MFIFNVQRKKKTFFEVHISAYTKVPVWYLMPTDEEKNLV
jgi:hypothetical protein